MTSEQPGLFDELAQPTTLREGQGLCPLCERPQFWKPRIQDWSRYCGSNVCTSSVRICQYTECRKQFRPGIDGRSKYCSIECMSEANRLKPKTNRYGTPCAWCKKPAEYRTAKPEGEYVCNSCAYPLRHVKTRLDMHHVPAEMRRQLIADPSCQICGSELLTLIKDRGGRAKAHLVIDHDHGCCPGSTSCGKCIRGFLCGTCNTMIGLAYDSVENLEAAAAYLRSHKLRARMREQDQQVTQVDHEEVDHGPDGGRS